jgi:hypothetical protein
MIKIITIVILCSVNIYPQAGSLIDFLSKKEYSLLKSAQIHIHNSDFQYSENLLDSLVINQNVSIDFIYFLSQANYFWKYLFTKNDLYLNKTIEYGKKNISYLSSIKNMNLRQSFFLAGSNGYLGLAKFKKGSIIEAMNLGKDGYNLYKKLLKNNPHFDEAKLGLGLFEGLFSELPFFIRIISFPFGFSGSIDSAKVYLASSAKSNLLTKSDSWFWTVGLIEEDSVLKNALLDSLVITHPNNPVYHLLYGSFLRKISKPYEALKQFELAKNTSSNELIYLKSKALQLLGETYFEVNDYKKSIANFHFLENLSSQPPESNVNIEKVYIFLYKNYSALGDSSSVKKYFDLLLNINSDYIKNKN